MRSYLYVYKIKKEESSDIFLRICHSIENKLHPSFIDQLIVDFDKSRVQRYIFPNNRILLYDDIQSDCVIMQTDQPCTLSNLKEQIIHHCDHHRSYLAWHLLYCLIHSDENECLLHFLHQVLPGIRHVHHQLFQ